MATEVTSVPVNGGQPYDGQRPNNGNSPATYPTPSGTPAATGNGAGTGTQPNTNSEDVPKDQVAWYFVEQYYKTMSMHPDRLHLFYNKRSQYVYGNEDEKVMVCIGPRAIADRVRELDIQDCKVRVTNVDSQTSFNNIIVQVIGEMSMKSAPHKKFVQTFVLAEQPNGYFILNDILRYIDDDEVEETEDVPETAPEPTPAAQETVVTPEISEKKEEPVQEVQEHPAVPEPVEEKAAEGSPDVDTSNISNLTNGSAQSNTNSSDSHTLSGEPASQVETVIEEEEPTPIPEVAEAEVSTEVFEPERPQDPKPTPAAVTPTTETPSQPAAPPKPKTWANLVAGPRAATPVVPATSTASSTSASTPAPTQSKAAPSTQSQVATSTPGDASPNPADHGPGSGWQTAGPDYSKRQTRPQSISGPGDNRKAEAFIKNVTDHVNHDALRSALSQFGKIVYFDVARPKNCAFVEFADMAGFNAARSASPLQVGDQSIWVEERRRGPTGGRGDFSGAGRGGAGRNRGDGRAGGQGRGGFQKDGGRNTFGSRNRGGNMTPKSRPQAA
ncbi:MAG: hypothetical protein M1834_000667 [Cirrosporium novae-zelandiae]|nr:MAG: hypothetical protein M1834_000667 [Cirrosporium novae-zelandiae]